MTSKILKAERLLPSAFNYSKAQIINYCLFVTLCRLMSTNIY